MGSDLEAPLEVLFSLAVAPMGVGVLAWPRRDLFNRDSDGVETNPWS